MRDKSSDEKNEFGKEMEETSFPCFLPFGKFLKGDTRSGVKNTSGCFTRRTRAGTVLRNQIKNGSDAQASIRAFSNRPAEMKGISAGIAYGWTLMDAVASITAVTVIRAPCWISGDSGMQNTPG